MFMPWFPTPVPFPVLPALPTGLRPSPVLARRQALLGQRAMPAIEPLYGFFAGGHAIGGPTGEAFRGVLASSFPSEASALGPGGPLAAEALGLAGQRMYLPGLHGEAWR